MRQAHRAAAQAPGATVGHGQADPAGYVRCECTGDPVSERLAQSPEKHRALKATAASDVK